MKEIKEMTCMGCDSSDVRFTLIGDDFTLSIDSAGTIENADNIPGIEEGESISDVPKSKLKNIEVLGSTGCIKSQKF